ncbi:MAG: hypothetical protein JNN13_18330 [Planctomycetes bacterium]|nr:hypothetical protein [Planctomycetota bacterium]
MTTISCQLPEPRRGVTAWWPLATIALLLCAGDYFLRLTYPGRAINHTPPWSWLVATAESTLPTLFTVVVTFVAGLGFWRAGPRRGTAWRVTGALFCYLAIDDLLCLHERLGGWLEPCVGDHGAYVWVCTLGPVFAITGLACGWRLLRDLATEPARRACLFVAFAALAVALGFEAFESAALDSTVRLRGMRLVEWNQWVEESLEVLAPVLLVAAAWTQPPHGTGAGELG